MNIDHALERWLHEHLHEGYPSHSPGSEMETRRTRDGLVMQRRKPPRPDGSPALPVTAQGTATRPAGHSRPAAQWWSPEAARVERIMQALHDADGHAHYALMCQLRVVDCQVPAEAYVARTQQTVDAYRQAVRRARLAVRVALSI